jgi:hypothetical protein
VNFYTFSFRGKILFIFASFLFFTVVLDFSLAYIADRKTEKNKFISNKFSKSKHMYLNCIEKKDYIFIGSSRTVFHISTNVFKNQELDVYNFGVSDRTIFDYTYMVQKVINLPYKPKRVVISLKKSDLYVPYKEHFNSISMDDIKAIGKVYDMGVLFSAIKSYVKNFHQLFTYADPMYLRLKQLYERFNPLDEIVMDKSKKNNIKSTSKLEPSKSDCNIFDYNYPTPIKIVAKCTNGDGILFGNTIEETNVQNNKKVLNTKKIELLNSTLKMLKNNDIESIIIFDPLFQSNLKSKNIDAIEADYILDLTYEKFKQTEWADSNHLNVFGRDVYSKLLVKKFKELQLEKGMKNFERN